MTSYCTGPDPGLGVALRLTQYVSCEARTLGENGFLALAGGPLGTGLLTGLVTIFIALIGYRMLLGSVPSLRDGVGWAVRLGIVLALVTSWSAFQTLVYRVAVDGPMEIAGSILPASGLPSSDLSGRVQDAYDTLRLGTVDVAAPQASAQSATGNAPQQPAATLLKFQSPLPNTASLLVISTMGVIAALQIAIGFLLAAAPLPLMSLLFQGTSGLFNGWLRALAGAALTMVAATVVTAMDLVMVESELGRLEALRFTSSMGVVDPQALTTIVALFAFIMLVLMVLSMKMAGALKLPPTSLPPVIHWEGGLSAYARPSVPDRVSGRPSAEQFLEIHAPSRVAAVAEVLSRTMHRERSPREDATGAPSRPWQTAETVERSHARSTSNRLGLGGRKAFAKRTRSVARRDKMP